MALATRCPHCETVFKLDPHLLAPHDGRVRCGHCQEVFDAAHHRFELPDASDEIQHAAIVDDDVAIGPSSSPATKAEPAPAPSPRPTVAAPRTLDVGASLAGRPPVAPPARPREEDDDRTVYAGANARAEKDPVKQFVRVRPAAENDEATLTPAPAPTRSTPPLHIETPPPPLHVGTPPPPMRAVEPPPYVAPVDDRAEPFIGPMRSAPPPPRPAPSPPPAWREDDEPAFGSKFRGAAHPMSANEAFPAARQSHELHELHESYEEEPAAPRSRKGWRVFGAIVGVLLALLLIVQIAWWQREQVMVLIPGTHSIYAEACDQIGCTISPPRAIDGLQIESSGLRQVDGPHKLELKLSLRNRLDVALAYPALELTLLDDQNNVAIRRVLWPQDYARPGTIFAIGIPPQSAQPVVIRLDTGDTVAANYRVQVFYP
jgi:predicted Zn finger-like uncharacterized protein